MFSSSGSSNNGFDFPLELHHLMFQLLSVKELIYVSATSKYNHGLFHALPQSATIWRVYHEKHFGKPFCNENLKEQTIAAFLYRFAVNAKHVVDKQRLFCHLFEYLKPFHSGLTQTTSLAFPYLARMYAEGLGVRSNAESAVYFLKQLFLDKHPKAPIILADFASKDNCICIRMSFADKTTPVLVELLKESYASHEYEAALYLGHIYRYGRLPNSSLTLDVNSSIHHDEDAAMSWYWKYYEHGFVSGLQNWVALQVARWIPDADKRERVREEVHQVLLKERGKYPNSATIARTLCLVGQSFRHERWIDNIRECEQAFMLDPTSGAIAKKIFEYYDYLARCAGDVDKKAIYQQQKDKWYRAMVRNGEYDGLLFSEPKPEMLPSIIHEVKAALLQQSPCVYMRALRNHYVELFQQEDVANKWSEKQSEAFIWLVFLAQAYPNWYYIAGKETENKAHEFICALSKKSQPFAVFALGMIALYGILGDSLHYPDRKKALSYFHEAYALSPPILENYIAMVDRHEPRLMSEGLRYSLRKIWETDVVPKSTLKGEVQTEVQVENDTPKLKV